jgi:hypothetical protein
VAQSSKAPSTMCVESAGEHSILRTTGNTVVSWLSRSKLHATGAVFD